MAKTLEEIFNKQVDTQSAKPSLDDIFQNKKTPTPIVKKEENPMDKPLGERFKETINRRATNVEDIITEGGTNKLTVPEQVLGVAGQVITTPFDLAFDVLAKFTPNIIKTGLQKGVGKVLEMPVYYDKEAGKNITGLDLLEKYEKKKKEDPAFARIARDAESIANIASVAPLSKGASAGAKAGTELAESALKTTGKAIKSTAKGAEELGVFGVSKLTGLTPNTIKTIIASPKKIAQAELKNLERTTLAGNVKEAIDSRLSLLADTGKVYSSIRAGAEKVNVPKKLFSDMLKKNNIEISGNKLKFTQESIPLAGAEKKQLNEFINLFGKSETLTPNAFLNARSMLSEMAKFDSAKSNAFTSLAKKMRVKLNELRPQISGLKEVDSLFRDEKKFLSELKSDYVNKAGELKDNAITKIANLTGKGKEQTLERLKKLIPDIDEQINMVRVLEDIASSKGIKVGTYAQAGLAGGIAVTGNIPGAVLSLILSSPNVIVPILKAYGIAKGYSANVINSIILKMKKGIKLLNNEKEILDNAINNYSEKVTDYAKNTKPGLTIEDVSNFKSPSVGKTAQKTSLIQEAKGKSFDEFLKGQDVIYHGTQSKTDKLLTSFSKKSKYGNQLGDGIYFTGDEKIARPYGENIFILDKKKLKIFDGEKDLSDVEIKKIVDLLPGNIKKDELALSIRAGSQGRAGKNLYYNTEFYGGNKKDVNDALKKVGYKGVSANSPDKKIGYVINIFDDNTLEKAKTKSQLKEIWEKANKGTENLIQEAKKYKSADEFVKAQDTLYHSGTADIKQVDLNKTNFSKTFYLSDKAEYAKSFGGKNSSLNEMVLELSANLADMRKPSQDLVSQIKKIAEGTNTGKTIKIPKPDGTSITVPTTPKDSISFSPYSTDTVIQGIKDGKAHFAELPEVKDILKKLGYDGQITSEVPYAKNIGVWNTKVIKTKSQLKKIWEKANK